MFALLIAAAVAASPSPELAPSTAGTAAATSSPSAAPTPAPSFEVAPAPAADQSPAVSPSNTPGASLAPCPTAKIEPLDTIDTKTAQPGAPFRFKVTEVDAVTKAAFPKLVPSAPGWGIVSVVARGKTGGTPGLLVLETRFIVASDGSHVPATFARTINGLFMGKTHNSPMGTSYIPIVGFAASAYDAFHRGGDLTVGPDEKPLTVVLGDGADMGSCSLPSPSP